MFEGVICGHVSCTCDADRFVGCCAFERDLVCIRQSCCLAVGVPSRGCGCVTDPVAGEICKVACLCADCGLIFPSCDSDRPLCSSVSSMLCMYQVCSFPFHKDYVAEPVCAYYGLQCCPNCDCCGPPPKSAALERLIGVAGKGNVIVGEQMDRGDGVALKEMSRGADENNFGYRDHPAMEKELA